MKAKITIARHSISKEPKHISEVENGAKCACICFECDKSLIAANKGKIQEHHFKHNSASNCGGSPETGLHLLAKRIVVESNNILISEDNDFDYVRSHEEKSIGSMTPDVQICNSQDENWLVEIAVSHYCDVEKIYKLKNLNVNCIEIDLNKTNRFIEIEELRKLVLFDPTIRRVISRKLNDEEKAKELKTRNDDSIRYIIGGIVAIIGFRWLLKKR